MYITGLEAKNCYSFDHVSLSLDTYPIVQIIGNNLDEKRININETNEFSNSANGVGKTNLYNLILQALYSRDLSRTKKPYLSNLYNKGKFSINLYLLIGKDHLHIDYNFNETLLFKNDKLFLEGRKNITDFFENLIPYEMFLRLTYLSPLVHFRFFDAANKEVQELLTLIFSDLMHLKNKLPLLKEEKQNLLKEIVEKEKEIKHFTIQSEQDFFPTKKVPKVFDRIDYSYKLTELGKQWGAQNNQIKREKELKSQLKEVKKVESVAKEYQAQSSKCALLLTKLEECKSSYTKFSKLKGKSICPTCGSKINVSSYLEKLEEQGKEIKAELEQSTNEHCALEEQNIAYTKYLKDKEEQDRIITELRNIILPTDLDHLKNEIDRYNSLQKEENRKSIQNSKEIAAIEKFNTQQQVIKDQIKHAQSQLLICEKELDSLRNKVSVLEVLETVCNKVVIAKQIPKRLEILENFINSELAQYTSQYSVKLSMKNDKIVREVIKEKKVYPVENLSSGEKTRLNISLLFAIRNILKALHKNDYDINIIFFDECFNTLDISGRNILLEAGSEFNKFVISHAYISTNYPIIELTRKDNKTNLKEIEV